MIYDKYDSAQFLRVISCKFQLSGGLLDMIQFKSCKISHPIRVYHIFADVAKNQEA